MADRGDSEHLPLALQIASRVNRMDARLEAREARLEAQLAYLGELIERAEVLFCHILSRESERRIGRNLWREVEELGVKIEREWPKETSLNKALKRAEQCRREAQRRGRG